MTAEPEVHPAVDALGRALADWLASFTAPQALAATMADACAEDAAWPAAIAAVAARGAGWTEAEALAWGIAVGALAGALEAGHRSLAPGREAGEGAHDGPARELLAADALVAAAHEALSSLPPDRMAEAAEALEEAFGDGGPWRALAGDGPRPAWPAIVPCALAPAADSGAAAWAAWRGAWSSAFGDGGGARVDAAWDEPAGEPGARALMRAAAHRAERTRAAGDAGG